MTPLKSVPNTWQAWLSEPVIHTFYKCGERTPKHERLYVASTFLEGEELRFSERKDTISFFEVVEQHFKNKVVTYAAAFIEGATNGGELYYDARQKLLTWHAIFEGATFRNGVLVEGQ